MIEIFRNAFFGQTALCNFPGPTYLIFSNNVPPLVYYSHFPIALLAFAIGCFVLYKNPNKAFNRLIFTLTLSFSLWVFLDSIFWATNRSDVFMFVWSLQILFEPIVYISALYISHLWMAEKDLSFKQKLFIVVVYLPVVLLVPTGYTLSGFNVGICMVTEGPIAFYTYAAEIIYVIWIIGLTIHSYRINKTNARKRKEILWVITAILLLLFAFSFGNIISSFTEDWNYAQIGLFMMPIFIVLLTYAVIRFGTFNIKLFSAQALVVGLWFLVFALLFVRGDNNTIIITLSTLFLVSVIGYILILSVAKEIKQREEVALLASQLTEANEQLEYSNERLRIMDQRKSEFVSIASHQLRTPVTAMKGYSSLLLEDAYGAVPEKMKDPIDKIFRSSERLALMITDFLNVSKIEQGSMTYTFVPLDLKKMVVDLVQDFHIAAGEKKLDVETDIPDGKKFNVVADEGKIRQIISNLLDNAIKYTPEGSVRVSLKKEPTHGEDGMILLQIKDTGIGLSQDDIHHLFGKFTRGAEGSKVNTSGSGLGLYVAKKMMEEHKGNIWVDSEGKGKGSVFCIELPEFHNELPPK